MVEGMTEQTKQLLDVAQVQLGHRPVGSLHPLPDLA
jgi:hypothetical protein